ncbi:MAG: kelch repeat-containing protein [Terriglobales bacterium]|jgi:N-acetylneuraminic acid mutarotase
MKYEMKSRAFMFMLVVIASLSFSSCDGGSTGGSTPPPSNANEWTWMNGANVANQPGTYGTLGTADSSNIPAARGQSVSWIDASGNFWLFSGDGTGGFLNDLWKYSAGEWTWMGGSNVPNQPGTSGTLGTPASGNVPGARYAAVGWTDTSGNFWLFAGTGFDSTGTGGILNDLWKYNAGQWTWMGGSNKAGQSGTYGTQGTAASSNIPGARVSAVTWTDASGNLWLFGGGGLDSTEAGGLLNDLWKYNASAGQWTWMCGSNVVNHQGIYGTQGTASPSNVPGAREQAVGWTDASGNFWLFGGIGFDSAGNNDFLNDLWKYNAGQWMWMGGSNMGGQSGTYGTRGRAASANVPGARVNAVSSIDASGNFWLFGGVGTGGALNDLWKYSAGEWTWVSGANMVDRPGTYGTQGTAASGNVPGARQMPVNWTDASGNFWLFGGNGFDSAGTQGYLNDLWKYEP